LGTHEEKLCFNTSREAFVRLWRRASLLYVPNPEGPKDSFGGSLRDEDVGNEMNHFRKARDPAKEK
jgi:hypothetical protein